MRVVALVTSGKDSALALMKALDRGYQVEYLATMYPQRADSWMFHYPNIHLTDLFSEAVGIPLVKAKTSGVKEVELRDLRKLLAPLDVDAVISGGISSRYQKQRIDRICEGLGLRHIAPLWHKNPLKLLNDILVSKIEAFIIGVYAHGFDQTWLGRKIDRETVDDLVGLNRKYQVSIVGEGGEYETLVLDAPFFTKRIELITTEKVWEGESGYLQVREAALVEKKKEKGK